ncbi:MAG: hypothetical protein ABC585_04865 [Candidatus Methanosuratincola petrocarbonis]
MKKRMTILLLAALFIAAVPIASTLATANAQTYESQQTICSHSGLQTQDREQLRDRECAMTNPADSMYTLQERVQQRIQERSMICSQSGICCNSSYDCQGFTFQLREMLQTKNQNCNGFGK